MHGDFSRWLDDPVASYSRVLFQQGRVQLDQDFNEQIALGLALQRLMLRDLIGPHGAARGGSGPDAPGFAIGGPPDNPVAGAGRYWVEGWPVRNAAALALDRQPAWQPEEEAARRQFVGGAGLVWLDVWERSVSAAEQQALSAASPWAPGFLDPALGGAETTLRARLAWRLRVAPGQRDPQRFVPPRTTGRLAVATAEAGYAGQENRLYRVEIHTGGDAATARFTWSRDNGATALAVRAMAVEPGGLRIEALRPGGLAGSGPRAGDWVELIDAAAAEGVRRGPLAEVLQVAPDGAVLHLAPPQPDIALAGPVLLLRRWDQRQATLPVAGQGDGRHDLEDGLRLHFTTEDARGQPARFLAGDAWLIAARPAIGAILWPREAQASGGTIATACRPQWPWRGHAPLAVFDPRARRWREARRLFDPLGG